VEHLPVLVVVRMIGQSSASIKASARPFKDVHFDMGVWLWGCYGGWYSF